MGWFVALILLVGVERLAELVVSTKNAAWSFARGGVETGRGHFVPMVALHTGLLVGALVEVLIRSSGATGSTFIPALGWPMLALAVASQGLRWWCIGTLGSRWNTRIIIVPGLPPVTRGPYRFFRHPNYVAVVVEGFALPLVGSAWITALTFTLLNAVFLGVRITAENRALALLPRTPLPEPA